ncbi:MAG: tetratricopeptide repeat protein [Opitutaceae bacterium]|nr:tetratricopeptide repeat protein [Opitutaceae bacterium]
MHLAVETRPRTFLAGFRSIGIGVVIVAAIFAAYHKAIQAPFLFDDHSGVLKNETIRSLWPPSEVLSPPPTATGAGGRPVVNLSLAFDYALHRLDPSGYHLSNIVFHVAAAWVVWGLVTRVLSLAQVAKRFEGNASYLGAAVALIWGIHPLQTESVCCIIQRSEILGGLFYLLTVYAYVRGMQSPHPFRWYIGSAIAAFLGAFTKEFIATAPLVILVVDRALATGSWHETWMRRKRAIALVTCFTWIPLFFVILSHDNRGGTVGFGLGVGSWEYLLTQCRAIFLYLRLSFWPDRLVLDYGDAVVSDLSSVWMAGASLVVACLATARGVYRGEKWAVPSLWFFAILAPSSSFVPLTTQTIAEHRMYLPLAAIVVGAIVLLHLVVRRIAVTTTIAVFLAVALSAATATRTETYLSRVRIWEDTVEKVPTNRRAHLNLGNALAEEGRIDEAIKHYVEALRLRGDFHEAHFNLGNALARKGDFSGAVGSYLESLRLRPNQPAVLNNLGLAYSNLGRTTESVASFRQVVALDPLHVGAHFNLAQELGSTRQFQEAKELLLRCVELRPDHPRYRIELAESYLMLGAAREAETELSRAAELPGLDARMHLDIGRALLVIGKASDALLQLERAKRLRPDLPGLAQTMELATTRAGAAGSNTESHPAVKQ